MSLRICQLIQIVLCVAIALSAWQLLTLSSHYCLNSSVDFDVTREGKCGVDMDQYVDYSNSLMSGHGFSAHHWAGTYGYLYNDPGLYVPETNRMPGMSVLLAGLRTVWPERRALYILNLLWVAGIVTGGGLLARRWGGAIAGLIVALWLVNNAQIHQWVGGGGTDIPTTFAVVWFVLAIVARERWWTLTAAGGLAVAAVFLRSNALTFFLPALLAGVFLLRRKRLVYPLVAVVLATTGWAARNYRVTGHFTISTHAGPQLLLEYPLSEPKSEEQQWYLWYSDPTYQTIKAIKAGLPANPVYADQAAEMQRRAWAWIYGNPGKAARVFWNGWVRFMAIETKGWVKTPMDYMNEVFSALAYALFLIVAVAMSLRGRIDAEIRVIIFATAAFLSVSCFWHGDWIGARGSLPMVPLLFALIFKPIHVQTHRLFRS